MIEKSKIRIFLLLMWDKAFSQESNDFLIKANFVTDKKQNIFSYVRLYVNDFNTKKNLPPIIGIEGISFSNVSDTGAVFFLAKGKHSIQVECIGYKYSSIKEIRTSLKED